MNRVLFLALVLVGCDSDSDFDPCAEHEPSTDEVSETQKNEAYPEPAGGTIVDGTYDLVRFEVYAPATADDTVRARRIVFDGDKFVSVNVDDGAEQQIGGTWSTSGTDLVFDVACPSTQTVTIGFTFSGDELWLHDSEPNVQVYRRID